MSAILKRAVFNLFRRCVLVLNLLQRIPLAVIFVSGFLVVFLSYKVTKGHKLVVAYSKGFLRYFFFINGIQLRWDKETCRAIKGQVVCSNYFALIDYAIVFLILPYQTLVLMPSSFFTGKILKSGLHLLGFYPSETNFDIHNYQSKPFYVESYAKNGFNLVECIHVKRQEIDPIPYVVMLAVKLHLPICFLTIKGSEQAKLATFFTPKIIEISHEDTIHPNKRPELTLQRYRQQLERYQPYEKKRRQQKLFK